MKSINTMYSKVSIILSLVIVLLTACTQSGEASKSEATNTVTEQPQIDIQTAVITGNLEAVKKHIEAGTDINQKEQMTGATPLITAATFNKKEILKALIDAGADLSIKNNDGSTALHTAAFFCRVDIVKLLIDAGADKTIKNNMGATPRETVMGPFEQVQPFYKMLQDQLSPFGLQLDMAELEKTRPVIATMLQ